MSQTIRVSMAADIVISRCIFCGVPYGVTSDFEEDRRNDKRMFYCPNGHPMSYTESETDRLRRERDRLKQQMAEIEESRTQAWNRAGEETIKRATAEKELRRINKRITSGVCPCCNRSFQNVARHMSTKHPNVTTFPKAQKAATK